MEHIEDVPELLCMSFNLTCDHYSVVEMDMHSLKGFPDFDAVIAGGFRADFIVFTFAIVLRATDRTRDAHFKAVCGKVRGAPWAASQVISSVVLPLFRRPARQAVRARFGQCESLTKCVGETGFKTV